MNDLELQRSLGRLEGKMDLLLRAYEEDAIWKGKTEGRIRSVEQRMARLLGWSAGVASVIALVWQVALRWVPW